MAVGDFNVGSNIDLTGNKIKKGGWEVLATAPSSPVAFQQYNNSTDGKSYIRNSANTAWVDISTPSGAILANGTVPFTADESMGGFKMTNLGNGVAQTDAINRGQLDLRLFIATVVDTTSGRTPSQLVPGFVSDFTTLAIGNSVLIANNSSFPGVYIVQASGPAILLCIPAFCQSTVAAGLNYNRLFLLDNVNQLLYIEYASVGAAKASLVNTDGIQITDGANNNLSSRISFFNLKATILSIPLLGWVIGSNASVVATDTISGAIGKLQAQINATISSVLSSLLTGYTAGTNTVLTATTSFLDAFRNLQAQITAYAFTAITFTNKSIDASTNTITNINAGMFAPNVIDNDATMAANSATRIPTQQATKTYIDNKLAGQSWKTAVRAATVANGALATAFANGQVIDGVTLVTGDRIALKNQTTASENGIYTVNASGAPTRATDADTGLELFQASFFISEGTTLSDTQWTVSNNGTITVGTTGLTFSQIGNGSVPSAGTAVEGKVFLATLAEAEAKTDTLKAVVSADLANFPLGKSTPFLVGNGSATQFALTHNFGKKIKSCKIRKVSDGSNWGDTGVDTSTSVYTIYFGAYVPTTNEFEIELVA